ncbi:LytR/AlgR family response regulator transcription factor [Pleionea sediminis]|uniref:LytR/AlgR family response regulator transcription factor n=1 Tax=Pleionea sediminis TaxID=2569479 RepID=UPI001184CED9|nr:LytTR family DNA-binding domain-containing protein [Pleionea sediminis]
MNRLEHFQKYQRWYEVGLIALFFLINNSILATSILMEAKRSGERNFQLWEPFVWEYTSAMSTVILLWPLFRFISRYPIVWEKLLRSGFIYFFASIVFSLFHVAIMVALRKVIYFIQGGTYDFGSLGFELLYEYRKDLWSFIFIIAAYHSYLFIIRQLTGEANLVQAGEESVPNNLSDRLLVKKLGKEFIIRVSDIEWMESSGNYVNLHVKGRVYPMRTTLSALVDNIAEKGFCRIHRSHAINLDAIETITPFSSGDSEVKLLSGKVLNMSRRYKDQLKGHLL